MGFTRFVVVALCIVFTTPALANYILTAPPRETPAKGLEIYQPVAEYLSRQTGKKVVYQHPGTWEQYSNNMQNDKFDIVFDGPHFAAWRMKHLKHKPLVRLRGNLRFHVVTRSDRKDISNLYDLSTKKTCGIASPNLSMLSFLSQFHKGSDTPRVLEIKGGMNKVYKNFQDGKCDAAVLRDSFYKRKISGYDRDKLKIIFTTAPLPNQTLTISSRVDGATSKKIKDSLKSVDGARSAKKLMRRFSKRSPTFTTAREASYKGSESFLEKFVTGW